MDRLVCGDVGFGKTEVAMREICFRRGAEQPAGGGSGADNASGGTMSHLKTALPTGLCGLKFYPASAHPNRTAKTIEDLAEGKVDIVIGTHKILQENVQFKNLGLMIVDEEHRFGVRDKERIKAMRADVDMLTLTATPIPRTLNMAFSGMRDLSIIATPPARRLAVKTFVQEHTGESVKEAILH